MKIDFEFQHPVYGRFCDALHLPDDHGYTEDEINAMKQQRFDRWVSVVEAASQDDSGVEIDGEVYRRLEGLPPPGAQLREIDGIWHYKA